jgi:hypothetical protein
MIGWNGEKTMIFAVPTNLLGRRKKAIFGVCKEKLQHLIFISGNSRGFGFLW